MYIDDTQRLKTKLETLIKLSEEVSDNYMTIDDLDSVERDITEEELSLMLFASMTLLTLAQHDHFNSYIDSRT